MESFYERVPNDDLLKDYLTDYITWIDENEFEKIVSKINTSKKIRIFLKETLQTKVKPTATDFLAVIHSIFYFKFSNPVDISIASILLLNRWNQSVAIPFGLSNNIYLNKTFFKIIDKSNTKKYQFSCGINFFDNFIHVAYYKYGKIYNTDSL